MTRNTLRETTQPESLEEPLKRTALLAALAAILAAPAAAAPPTPDPPPGGAWDGTFVDMTYDTTDTRGFYRMRVFVPGDGSRRQVSVIGYTRRGAVAAIRGITPMLHQVYA